MLHQQGRLDAPLDWSGENLVTDCRHFNFKQISDVDLSLILIRDRGIGAAFTQMITTMCIKGVNTTHPLVFQILYLHFYTLRNTKNDDYVNFACASLDAESVIWEPDTCQTHVSLGRYPRLCLASSMRNNYWRGYASQSQIASSALRFHRL